MPAVVSAPHANARQPLPRRVASGDISAVARLYRESFGRVITTEWYQWQMRDPLRPEAAPVAWLCGDARALAHYGASPLRVRVGGMVQPALHGCDIMCAADQRGRGLTSALAAAAHADWADRGYAFVLGLPTESWGGLRQRLGCRTAFPLGWLWRPLRLSALVPRRWLPGEQSPRSAGREPEPWPGEPRSLPSAARTWLNGLVRAGRGVEVTRVEGVPGSEFDYLYEQLCGGYDIMVVRDRAWVAHRFGAGSGIDYVLHVAWRGATPVGYIAHRVIGGARTSGWVAELFTAPADTAARAALLRASVAAMCHAGAEDVRVFAAPQSALHAGLRAAGFLPRRGGYDLVTIPLASSVADARDPRRWFIGSGDFDVI